MFGELVPGSRSRVLRLEMIGERVSSSAGLCIRGGAGRPWDVRVARVTAKVCEHPYVRRGPAGWLVITLRPPSGIGVRRGIDSGTSALGEVGLCSEVGAVAQ